MNPIPGDPITIESGKLSGTLLDSGVKAYLGVPFAAPPVRELRWAAPQPVKPWIGVYNADNKITKLLHSAVRHHAEPVQIWTIGA